MSPLLMIVTRFGLLLAYTLLVVSDPTDPPAWKLAIGGTAAMVIIFL